MTVDVSFVLPAYNVSETIGTVLRSICEPLKKQPCGLTIEIIIVDDGSNDHERLTRIMEAYPNVKLYTHSQNFGMCAARNTGIRASSGKTVVILDADDWLVPGWPDIFRQLLAEWPANTNVAFSACVDVRGKPTVSHPTYTGFMTLEDFMRERFSGEYLPIFRSAYIRSKEYIDLRIRKSCGTLSYLAFLHDGPFWISRRTIRVYNNSRSGSVTSNWASPAKARESYVCTKAILSRFEALYSKYAPRTLRGKYLRLAVYGRLAGEPLAWQAWRRGANYGMPLESIGALLVLIFGRKVCEVGVGLAKALNLVKKYG